MSKYYAINNCDIANGPGLRVTVFFTGCDFHCKGCFNQEIWDFEMGKQIDSDFYQREIKPLINEHIQGLSILGGEPMHPKNIGATLNLIQNFKRDFPDKTVWLWSGYTYEELTSEKYELSLTMADYMDSINILVLKMIDVLVDGRFEEDKKDLRLKWRGSTNQRILHSNHDGTFYLEESEDERKTR